MPSLWTFAEFDKHDSQRALHLRSAPCWSELITAVRGALGKAIETKNARFGFDESGRDARDLRGVVQFPVGTLLFDWLFNGTTGYRAQFRMGRRLRSLELRSTQGIALIRRFSTFSFGVGKTSRTVSSQPWM